MIEKLITYAGFILHSLIFGIMVGIPVIIICLICFFVMYGVKKIWKEQDD